ncbi:MAG: hypothetical protein ACMUHY_06785 [Thermoplasmatota archaeon]
MLGGLEIFGGTDTFKVLGFKRGTGSDWTMQEIFVDTDKNRGVWVGDVDPMIPGNELYSYGYSTNLVQITGSFASGWNTRQIWSDVARGHEIRIGEIDPTNDYNEIALVGYANNLSIVKPSGWKANVPFEGTGAIDGVAVGDADVDREGNEIVWCARDQKVYLGYYDSSGAFSYQDIWNSGGQQLTPAIGNLREDLPGNEILVVGLSSGTEDVDPGDGTATVLSKSGTGWSAERAFTDEKLVHGADIGDIDPTIDGEEAVIVTFSFKAYMIWWDEDHWNSSFIFQDTNNVRKVVIADLLPDSIHPGNELVAVSKSGNLTIAYGSKDGWTVDVIYSNPDEPFARVCVGDVDASSPGLEIFGGTDTFKVLGFKRGTGNQWSMQEIFVDTDKNRGVWVGDVDPDTPGNELYSFGYSTKLVQITGSFASGWNRKVIWNDVARGHELRVGDIHPAEGVEIVTVGYSNNVSVISMMDASGTSTPTITGGSDVSLEPGEVKDVPLKVESFMKIYFTADEVEDLEFELLPSTMYSSGSLTLKLKAGHVPEAKTVTIDLEVDYGSGKMTYPIEVDIAQDTTAPMVEMLTDGKGIAIGAEDEIMWNDTLHIRFSEPISSQSFVSARDAGTLKLESGGKAKDAVFTLSDDRMSIMVNLEPMKLSGTVLLTFDGLKDDAGLDISQEPLEVRVKGESEDENGIAWVIIIIVLVLLILVAGIIYFVVSQKQAGEGSEEGELPPEPKQI